MSDENIDYRPNQDSASDVSRRDFVALSVIAGVAAATTSLGAAGLPVVEETVQIKTPNGTCDASFIHPTTGSHPGVLIWADAFGLRPATKEMGKRVAAEGYSVLVPESVLSSGKVAGVWRHFVLQLPESGRHGETDAADGVDQCSWRGRERRGGADCVSRRTAASEQGEEDRHAGYCMGGPLVVRTAATVPDRVGAGASFHGGSLVSDAPNSPHLLAPRSRHGCILRSRRMTMHASPMRRTSCGKPSRPRKCPRR